MFKATSSRLSAAGKLPSHAELVDFLGCAHAPVTNIPPRIVIPNTLVLFTDWLYRGTLFAVIFLETRETYPKPDAIF